MKDILTVFRFTLRDGARKKAFWVTTIIVLVLIVGICCVPRVMDLFSGGNASEPGSETPGTSVGEPAEKTETCYLIDEQQLIPGAAEALAAALPLVTIFLYRRRLLQIRLCVAEMVLLAGAVVMEGVYYFLSGRLFAGMAFHTQGFRPAIALPLVALLFAGDRADAAAAIRGWLAEGKSVMLDRYVYSNVAYQCAKVVDPQARRKLRDWIVDLEYCHHAIPVPDLSLFLDVPFGFTKRKLEEVREGDDREELKTLVEVLQGDEVVNFINETYKGAVVPTK